MVKQLEWDDIERLQEIQEEMISLLCEASRIIRRTSQNDHAHSYWIAHAKIALTSEHGYLSRSPNMQQTIEALEAEFNDQEEIERVDQNIGGEP